MRVRIGPGAGICSRGGSGTNEMQTEEPKGEENDGLHRHRYALKLICQTLKVCMLTHASVNFTPTMHCGRPLRSKPLCGALAQEIIRCSISFCVEKGFKNCIIYFFYCAVFMRKAL